MLTVEESIGIASRQVRAEVYYKYDVDVQYDIDVSLTNPGTIYVKFQWRDRGERCLMQYAVADRMYATSPYLMREMLQELGRIIERFRYTKPTPLHGGWMNTQETLKGYRQLATIKKNSNKKLLLC